MQRVNLIPKELGLRPTVQFKSKVLMRRIAFLPLIVIFFCFINSLSQFVKAHNLQNRLRIAKEKLAVTKRKLEDTATSHDYLQKQIDEGEQKAQLLKEQKESFDQELRGAIKWSNILIELSRIIPKKTWLNSVLLNRGILTIKGSAFSNLEVSTFLKNLENSPLFTGVEFKSTERKELEEKKEKVAEFQIIGKLYQVVD
ncbi:MAG: hypothetical protein D4S01_04700 [Dehalococcoidia bacterium]|nr:MAG: hypothetical protein D4S01_04700 [Dehalococcoidia bacterium]